MRIAYFSPLNPKQSGISDYSEALLPLLSRDAEIDLWVEGYVPSNNRIRKSFKVIDYLDKPQLLEDLPGYDMRLFHVGNNPHHTHMYDVFLTYGGAVVLHDFVLYFLVAGYYLHHLKDPQAFIREMEFNSGDRGLAEAFRILHSNVSPLRYAKPHLFPLNRRLIERAQGIIVHSDYTAAAVMNVAPWKAVRKINLIGNFTRERGSSDCGEIRRKYHVDEDEAIIASLGYVAPTKRIHRVVRALDALRKRYRFKYILAGQGAYVDRLIRELGMSRLVMSTGYVPREELDAVLSCADIVVNLRYPSMGEASITLVDALTAGKPCIVSDHGWFSEIPGDVVVKVRPDANEVAALTESITYLIDHPGEAQALGVRAQDYCTREHSPARIARDYVTFLRRLSSSAAAFDDAWYLMDRSSHFFQEIGVDDSDDFIIDRLARRIAEMTVRGT